MLRHRVTRIPGHIAHRDPGGARRLQVDVVVTGGGHRHQPQRAERLEDRRRDLRLVDRDDLGAGAVLDDLGLGPVGQAPVLPERLQPGEVDVAVQADVGVVDEKDPHGCRVSYSLDGASLERVSLASTSRPLVADA